MKFTEELLEKIDNYNCIEICLRDEKHIIGDIYYNTCYYYVGDNSLNFEKNEEDNSIDNVVGTIKLDHIKEYKEEPSFIKVITK